MSAERRFNQRRFHLEESLTQNGGARTVFIEHMTPGTTVPPHYHNSQYKPWSCYDTHFCRYFDESHFNCNILSFMAGH